MLLFLYCPKFLTDSLQEQVTDYSNTTSTTSTASTTTATTTTSTSEGNNDLGKAVVEIGNFCDACVIGVIHYFIILLRFKLCWIFILAQVFFNLICVYFL